jgi:ATPase components of ABC transporters with duplicated ATPase domains
VALIRALRQYAGAILLVSHDRHFTRCVIEGESILPPSSDAEDEDEESEEESEGQGSRKTGIVYAVVRGRLKPLSGGTDDYVALVERRMRRLGIVQKG